MTSRAGPGADSPTGTPVREPQPACAAALLGTVCAAVALGAFVWTTYDSFDHSGFDLQAAAVAPIVSALAARSDIPAFGTMALTAPTAPTASSLPAAR